MSTELKDLQMAIFRSNRLNTQIDLQDDRRLEGSQLAWAGFAAASLLRAGYRKPRQVTTVEELDALPAGTVIRDGDPLTCIKWGDGTWGTFAGGSCPTSRITLPATVLHVGGAE